MTSTKAAVKFAAAIESLYMGSQPDAAIDEALALPSGAALMWRVLNGCPPNEAGRRGGRRPSVNLPGLLRLHAQGLTDGAIARSLGVSRNSVYLWRNKLGLPPNG